MFKHLNSHRRLGVCPGKPKVPNHQQRAKAASLIPQYQPCTDCGQVFKFLNYHLKFGGCPVTEKVKKAQEASERRQKQSPQACPDCGGFFKALHYHRRNGRCPRVPRPAGEVHTEPCQDCGKSFEFLGKHRAGGSCLSVRHAAAKEAKNRPSQGIPAGTLCEWGCGEPALFTTATGVHLCCKGGFKCKTKMTRMRRHSLAGRRQRAAERGKT